MKHYITKYRDESGLLKVVSWSQINAFGRAYTFWKRELTIEDRILADEDDGECEVCKGEDK